MKTNLAVISIFQRSSQSEPMLFTGVCGTPEIANSAAVAKVITWLKDSYDYEEPEAGSHLLDPTMTPDELEAWFCEWCAFYASSIYNEELDV